MKHFISIIGKTEQGSTTTYIADVKFVFYDFYNIVFVKPSFNVSSELLLLSWVKLVSWTKYIF